MMGQSSHTSGSYSTIYITLFIFRGQPDVYYKRHVLVYFTSPENPHFHETAHAQRDDDTRPWRVERIHKKIEWALSATYLTHVNAGAVRVWKGREMDPVNIVAATSVKSREHDSGWNCQNFALEGLQALVSHGLQTQDWYSRVEEDLMDQLLEGAVG